MKHSRKILSFTRSRIITDNAEQILGKIFSVTGFVYNYVEFV